MTTFKIHFTKENIRKVTLSHSLTYDTFITYLNETYSKHLKNEIVSLHYFDQDNDFITVTSQLEWEEMVSGEQRVVSVFIKEYTPEENTVPLIGLVQRGMCPLFKAQRRRGGCPRGNGPRRRGGCPRARGDGHRRWVEMRKRRDFARIFEDALRLMEEGERECLGNAKNLFLHALTLIPEHPAALYNVACVESLLGNVDEAVHVLKGAIEAGWSKRDHTLNDSDLDNIRHTEGYKECIRTLSEELNYESYESSDTDIEKHYENVVLPFETTFNQPEEPIEEPTPQPEPIEEPIPQPEQSNPLSGLLNVLTEMGFEIDPSVLDNLVSKHGTDLSQIINHFLN